MSPKYLKNTAALLAASVVIFGVFVSCENPFTRNLGEKVDVEWPTVSVSAPTVGSIINKEVTFEGEATAYRKVDKVEVRILNPDKTKPNLLNWTTVDSISSGDTSKRWSYKLDTAGPIFKNQGDDFLYIQFRAWDANDLVVKDANINTYAYTIKNEPSKIMVQAPLAETLSTTELTASLETGSEIQGQVIDVRGIKPGFPRIKIWPGNMAEPLGDDPNWGWVTLFLDDIDIKSDDKGTPAEWKYKERSERTVINSALFTFKLAEFTIQVQNPGTDKEIRKIVYTEVPSGGTTVFKPLPVIAEGYRFRIWTSDTYFVTDDDIKNPSLSYTASMKKWPRKVIHKDEVVLVGFNPPIQDYTPGVDDWNDHLDSGNSWRINVKTAGKDPDIEFDTDTMISEFFDKDPSQPINMPNSFITEFSTQKIMPDNASNPVFSLRIRVTHPDETPNATLVWKKSGADSTLPVSFTSTASGTDSHNLHYQKYSCTVYGSDAEFSSFDSGSRTYTLEVTATLPTSTDKKVTQTYTVEVRKSRPVVSIQTITGAKDEPTSTDNFYVVNGNIKVATAGGGDLVKWIVEPKTSTVIENAIDNYNRNPTADNLAFFNDIPNTTAASATVRSGRVANDGTFIFNTKEFSGVTDVWLYVIALDSVQSMGSTRVQLRINQNSDIPEITSSLLSTVDTPNPIDSEKKLFIQLGASGQTKRNILDNSTGIDLTFKDDDGINRSDITIKITDLNNNYDNNIKTRTFTAADESILTAQGQSLSTNSNREWAGTLSQSIMAKRMYSTEPVATRPTFLRDGIYKLEITYKDTVAAKISITAGDSPAVSGADMTYYFCVISNQPVINVIKPIENSSVIKDPPETITGTIYSRIPVQRLTLTFDPSLNNQLNPQIVQLCTTSGYNVGSVWDSTDALLSADRTETETINGVTYKYEYKKGYYLYYWRKETVDFTDTTGAASSEDRKFTLRVYDNLSDFNDKSWTVKVDNSPPVVDLDDFYFSRSLEEGQERHRVNGKFNFIISAKDNNGIGQTGNLDHVKWWIKEYIQAAPNWNDTVTTNGYSAQFPNAADPDKVGRYQAIVNSGTVNTPFASLPKGRYKLWAMAQDKAGNFSLVNPNVPGSPVGARDLYEFDIDQDADYPVMDTRELDPNGADIIRTSAGLKIKGRVTDDDGFTGFTNATVQIRFRTVTTPPNTTWATWQDVTTTKLDPTGALEFEYNIPTTGYFAGDGEKQYQIRVTEPGGTTAPNKNPTATGVTIVNTATIGALTRQFPTTTSPDYYLFQLKNTEPQIFFKDYDETTGTGHNSKADRPVFQNRTALLTALSGSVTVSGTTYTSKVVDRYLDSVTVSFNRDTKFPPVSLLGNIGQPAYTSGTSAEFVWNLSAQGLLDLTPGWLPSETDFNTNSTLYPDGMYTIVITARDKANNTKTAEWKFYKDTKAPVITFNNIEKRSSPPETPPLASDLSVIKGAQGTMKIIGRFEDDYSNIGSATYKFNGTVSGNVNFTPDNTPAKNKNWEIVIPANVPDGKNYFEITVSDAQGNSETVPNLWLVVDSSDPVVTNTGDMNVGGFDAYNPAKPIPDVNDNQRIFGAAGSSISPSSTTVIFTLSGTARDVNLRDMTFAIRSVSSAATPVQTNSLATKLPEWDTAAIGYKYQSADGDHRLTIQRVAAAVSGTWDWTLEILGKDLDALKTGLGSSDPCFVTITAQDLAGRDSEARHWRFYLDTQAPVVKPSNFQDTTAGKAPTTFGNSDSGGISLMGTAEDDRRVKTIQYRIEKWNYALNSGAGDWEKPASGGWSTANAIQWSNMYGSPYSDTGTTVSWTLSGDKLDATVYLNNSDTNAFKTDGRYRIYLQSTDWSLGAATVTPAVQGPFEFFIDGKDPAITWDTATKDKMFFRNKAAAPDKGTVSLSFTTTDVNSIDTVKVNIKGPGVSRDLSGLEITIPPQATVDAVNGYSKTIIIKPNLNSGNPWTDGRYTLTLTITDFSGNKTTLTRDIIVDNKAPGITINDVPGNNSATAVPNNIAITGRQEFRGSFTKDTGMSPVTFVAFYVAPSGANAPSDGKGAYTWLVDKDNELNLTTDRAALYTAGWRFYDSANGSPYPVLRDTGAGNRLLMKIADGLTNVNMLIPNTSLLTMSSPMYTGGNTTSGTEFNNVRYDGKVIPAGDAINKLEIYFLAVDEAGNRNVSVYDYWIYPEGDRPTVTLTSPDQTEPLDRRLINGRFRIGGTATDNFRVKTVWFRVLGKDGDMTRPFTKADNMLIPVWDSAGNPTNDSQTAVHLSRGTGPGSVDYGDGWFKASGGGKATVPWYAYINSNGELDPLLEGSRLIKIEVLAEDYQYTDEGVVDDSPGAQGLLTSLNKKKAVETWVVKGTPVFSNEEIRKAASADVNPAQPWYPVEDVNIRKRSAYRVTVSHEAGLKEITWTPPAGTAAGNNPINLLANNEYTTTIYTAAVNGMNNTTPSGDGIAVKAAPKTSLTGSGKILKANTRYLIWNWNKNDAAPIAALLPPEYQTQTSDEMRFVIIKSDSLMSSVNLGAIVLIEADKADTLTENGRFEWEVVVDVHADLINKGSYKYPNAPPYNGVYSGRFPVNLRATENSKSVALYTDYKAELPIDNQPPKAAYTHNAYVAGSAATIGGEAGDPAPAGGVSGLDRVVLWFSRKVGGIETSISWNGGTFVTGGTTPDGVTLLPGVTMPADYAENAAAGSNNSSIVMKYNDTLGNNAKFGHKLPIGFANVGGELSTAWYVTLDSTLITSGRITANYIVYDKAGNATYYTQKLVVMNGVPRITGITLATDIRGDTTLNTTFTGNGSWGDSRRKGTDPANDKIPTANRPMETIGNAVSAIDPEAVTEARKGISKKIPINTDTVRKYSVVYDEAFNVRNKLLAVKVDVDQPLGAGDMDRTFRVEYVSGARLLTGFTNAAVVGSNPPTLKDIKAGRIYMINNPGNRFPWGALGVKDVLEGSDGTYRRGIAFMAIEDGDKVNIPDVEGNYASPSVWELNSNYYGSTLNDPHTGTPNLLKLSDVQYTNTYPTLDTVNGKSAEFVYGKNAFDAKKFSETNTAGIHDFDPALGTNGRPTAYPYSDSRNLWEVHSLFIIRVFGGLEDELFGDFALLSIRVNNDDKTRPYTQLYDLNPKTEGQDNTLAGANETARRLTALSISEIGANRAKGGLYNTGTVQKVAKSGHIEPRANTNLTSPQMGGAASLAQASITKPFIAEGDKAARLFATDTVSGEVILRGYVEDDQRISAVRLYFYSNAGGAALSTVDILRSKSNPTNSGNFGLEVEPGQNGYVNFKETVDLDRHSVEWAYLWSTETIPGGNNVVANNINVYAVAYNANAALAQKTDLPSEQRIFANATDTTYDDYNPDYPATASNSTTGVVFRRYNRIPVNLRPYITGFRRNEAKFAHHTRSRQGWYMFAREEVAVVTGFNLLNGNGNTNISLPSANNIQTTNVGTIGDFGITTANNTRYRQFTVGANAITGNGLVTLTVNNFAAVNTPPATVPTNETANSLRKLADGTPIRPLAILPWNIERSPGTAGSELWDDFIQAHIWQSNDNAPGNGTGVNEPGRFLSRNAALIFNPAMSISPSDGTLYESHNGNGGEGDNADDWYNTSRTIKTPINITTYGTTPAQRAAYWVTQFSDPIFFSDVYRSPGSGNIAADTWAVSSIIGRSGTAQYWRGIGGVYISGPGGGPISFTGGGTGSTTNAPSAQNSTYSSSLYHGESAWYNSSTDNGITQAESDNTDQFMNPHIVTSYTTILGTLREHIHVSYYDDKDGSIKYRYNMRGAPGTIDGGNTANQANNRAIPKMWTNLDGGLDSEDTVATTHTSTDIGSTATDSIAANARVVRFTTDIDGTKSARGNIKAGRHNSIATTSEGYPVIAYYDETNRRLKLAVSRNAIPIQASNWVIRDYVIPQDDLNCNGTGEFVSMKIDTRNGANIIHIAAMNTNKRLVYITGQINPTAGTGNTQQTTGGVFTLDKVQVVDSVGNVGRWCALSLDSNGNPWISYMDESYLGARDGAKVAYLNTTTFYKGDSTHFQGGYIDLYGKPLTGWETMHVPTLHSVENPIEGPGREHGRLGMECYPTRNYTGATTAKIWSAAVGYLSQDAEFNATNGNQTVAPMDRYRVAYYVK